MQLNKIGNNVYDLIHYQIHLNLKGRFTPKIFFFIIDILEHKRKYFERCLYSNNIDPHWFPLYEHKTTYPADLSLIDMH